MFDRYIICENDFKNVEEAGETVGFQFNARLPYYRGLGISMVENLGITVNAEKFPREAIRVTLHGNTYSLDEMEQEYEDRWEFGEEGTVTVQKSGGLPAGLHNLEMDVVLRVSYLPFLLTGSDNKVLELAAS
ncbi:MAG TPA: DUF6379 domain-containing protein [Anaerolineales bacterium]|nr:DUF6379 domain-containing protein [Anaerolineales bacterium]